jgi:hypothetical protein
VNVVDNYQFRIFVVVVERVTMKLLVKYADEGLVLYQQGFKQQLYGIKVIVQIDLLKLDMKYIVKNGDMNMLILEN